MKRDHLFYESDAKGWYRKELTLVGRSIRGYCLGNFLHPST
jgi:hypothetical protein